MLTPTLQTTFGEKGNCLSAVIATMFDVKIEDVPFFEDYDEHWLEKLSAWASVNLNKFMVLVNLGDINDCRIFNGSLIITGINSDNEKVERHAVITRGKRIVFDPMVGFVDEELTRIMEPKFFIFGDMRLDNYPNMNHPALKRPLVFGDEEQIQALKGK